MAHYAEIDKNNIVQRVIVISDEHAVTEEQGAAYCHETFGGTWIKTSYNGNIRKVFASPGFYYNVLRDEFIPPQPYASWIFDNASHSWQPPVLPPNNEQLFYWDEFTKSWILYQG